MSAASDFGHLSVLYHQSIEQLAVQPQGRYIDCTLGGGGHSAGILALLGEGGVLYGFDKDQDALAAASERLDQVNSPATYQLIHRDFSEIAEACQDNQIPKVQGILADLGVSSWQLDQAERGFSYSHDGPLDMRMNQTAGETAADLVNHASEQELTRILTEYGEERYARRISQAIIRHRATQPFTTTGELAAVVRQAMPGQGLKEAQHPAITFHSLEDRLVKDAFRRWENPCTCPREFPVCICGKKPIGRVITRRPIIADDQEMKDNPRARSAKLRVFETLHPEPA
ncbi:MAG: rRNA ((1402)-N(4))-methyltransferase [Firmicutes bacterium]|nr:rRNA ((1402)-N(4))-methyltransferase [Bacillota bacterium]